MKQSLTYKMKKNGEETKNRDLWIDSIKGMAIIAVFISHSGISDLGFPIDMLGKFGRQGVQIFCIMSAYLTIATYSERNHAFKWLKKRMIRLIPVYYCALILAIISGQYAYWFTKNEGVGVLSLTLHFSLTHGFSPTYYNSIIRVEWYVGALVIFYLLFPFLNRLIRSLEKALLFWVISGFGIDFLIHIITHLEVVAKSENYNAYWSDFSFVAQFPCFISGFVFYYLEKGGYLDRVKEKKTVALAISVLAMGIIAGVLIEKTKIYGLTYNTVYSMCFLMIISAIKMCPLKCFCNRIFAWGGRHSYEIYLFHYTVITLCGKYILREEYPVLSWCISSLAAAIVTCIISICISKGERCLRKKVLFCE